MFDQRSTPVSLAGCYSAVLTRCKVIITCYIGDSSENLEFNSNHLATTPRYLNYRSDHFHSKESSMFLFLCGIYKHNEFAVASRLVNAIFVVHSTIPLKLKL